MSCFIAFSFALTFVVVIANIFPIFGLIFATMGLYRLIEDEQVDLVSTNDAKNYDRFNLGVARINHAFQQVKFWEFTQPCLYLARALPYISTGRTVEGYLVRPVTDRQEQWARISYQFQPRYSGMVSTRCISSKKSGS